MARPWRWTVAHAFHCIAPNKLGWLEQRVMWNLPCGSRPICPFSLGECAFRTRNKNRMELFLVSDRRPYRTSTTRNVNNKKVNENSRNKSVCLKRCEINFYKMRASVRQTVVKQTMEREEKKLPNFSCHISPGMSEWTKSTQPVECGHRPKNAKPQTCDTAPITRIYATSDSNENEKSKDGDKKRRKKNWKENPLRNGRLR